MEIQAYFEERSRRPGDTVRLAISTPHASIRAKLVHLISGPGQSDNIEGRVTDFSSVLDTTVPGRTKGTMVGSYAQLSLPQKLQDVWRVCIAGFGPRFPSARRLRRFGL